MIIEHKDDKHRTENDDINIDVEFNCHECDFQGTEKSQLEKHINWKHTLAKCDVCEFKGGNRIILEKHKKLVHERKVLDECKTCGQLDNKKSQVKEHNSNSQPTLKAIICRICGEQFMEKRNFMLHRKAKHIESVAVCKNSVEGKCVFSSEICFWKHKPDNMNVNSIECFICTETFQSKDSMMKHRKIEHHHIVKLCYKQMNNECTFGDEKCWYKHNNKPIEINKYPEDEQAKTQSFFQEVFSDLLSK